MSQQGASRAFSRIKGFADLFPPESEAFSRMESCGRDIFSRYGFAELRTPLLEFTGLFQRSIGAETDVVQKEMYTFADRKGRSVTLRPEATAGVMRACIESGLADARSGAHRFFTMGPMFRYERPQKGRMRQFHQINCECLGTESPFADAELIAMLWRFLQALGIADLTLKLNSLGCAACRPAYMAALRDYLTRLDADALCEDCRRRVQSNPLRVLDCKQPGCRALTEGAPRLLDHNCPDCRRHFDTVLELLARENITPDIDHRLVRGLDYYCRTTFEVVSGGIGAQTAVAGGGRYDG
uniref:histidine--tRNA ligase n=1 Tax=uncultured Desulfovibrio sp. TaxID=167968 RepID=UPI002631F8D8